jgi:hypothetical protein
MVINMNESRLTTIMQIEEFLCATFNPWLNMHRQCLFASETVSDKNKIIKRYKRTDVKTPLESLTLLAQQNLVRFKPGQSLAQ